MSTHSNKAAVKSNSRRLIAISESTVQNIRDTSKIRHQRKIEYLRRDVDFVREETADGRLPFKIDWEISAGFVMMVSFTNPTLDGCRFVDSRSLHLLTTQFPAESGLVGDNRH